MVVHLSVYMQSGLCIGLLKVCINKCSKGYYTHCCRFQKPNIAIDTSTFIEPSFFQCGIGANTEQIVATIVDVFCDVIHLSGIAAGLCTHIKTVKPNPGIAEHTIHLYADALPKIFLRNVDGLPIPAHAGLWKLPTYCLIAM